MCPPPRLYRGGWGVLLVFIMLQGGVYSCAAPTGSVVSGVLSLFCSCCTVVCTVVPPSPALPIGSACRCGLQRVAVSTPCTPWYLAGSCDRNACYGARHRCLDPVFNNIILYIYYAFSLQEVIDYNSFNHLFDITNIFINELYPPRICRLKPLFTYFRGSCLPFSSHLTMS